MLASPSSSEPVRLTRFVFRLSELQGISLRTAAWACARQEFNHGMDLFLRGGREHAGGVRAPRPEGRYSMSPLPEATRRRLQSRMVRESILVATRKEMRDGVRFDQFRDYVKPRDAVLPGPGECRLARAHLRQTRNRLLRV